MMQCDLHLDALYDTTDYTLRVDYAALAGGRVTTRARLDVTRRIPLRHGGTLPMTTSSLILHGTPQQMWDIGMMLVKGAEVYLPKVKRTCETCETCRWWGPEYTKEQTNGEIYEGRCHRLDMPEDEYSLESDKGLVKECDHDFGCNCWTNKKAAQESGTQTDTSIVDDSAMDDKEGE